MTIEDQLLDLRSQVKMISDQNDAMLHLINKMLASDTQTYTTAQAADYTGYSIHTIRKDTHLISGKVRNKTRARFTKQQLDAYMSSKKELGTKLNKQNFIS